MRFGTLTFLWKHHQQVDQMKTHIFLGVQDRVYKLLAEPVYEEPPCKAIPNQQNHDKANVRAESWKGNEGYLEDKMERTWRGQRRPEERAWSRNFQREGRLCWKQSWETNTSPNSMLGTASTQLPTSMAQTTGLSFCFAVTSSTTRRSSSLPITIPMDPIFFNYLNPSISKLLLFIF